jgi:hypothetical protein
MPDADSQDRHPAWHSSKPRMRGTCALPYLQSAIHNLKSKIHRGHSSVGRAPALQAGSQGFEPPCLQILYANSEARLSQRLSLFCDTRRTRQRIREARRRNFGHMPRLKHYVPGEAFDFQKSELVQWLMNNEHAFDLVFSALQSSGAIVFDSETGEWKGCDTS